jgi:hypothetical protein
MYREYLLNIISLKKYTSRDTIPLKQLRSYLTFTNEERFNNACRAESTNVYEVHIYEYTHIFSGLTGGNRRQNIYLSRSIFKLQQ